MGVEFTSEDTGQQLDAEETPSFDGGVREPAPGPGNPAAEHNALVSGLLLGSPEAKGDGGWG
jgi:hypothetical protein